MNRSTLPLHLGVLLILLVCIADCLFLKDKEHNRQKRGFRMNAAARVAHGYGKRDYSSLFDNQSPPLSKDSNSKQQLSDFLDDDEEETSGGLMSTQDFSRLLQLNEELAHVIVRKFIDLNDDGVISADELFRRLRE